MRGYRSDVAVRSGIESGLNDINLLHALSVELRNAAAPGILFRKIVDAAVKVMRSDFGTLQLIYPDRGGNEKLRIVASHGFTREAERYWEWIYHHTASSCGEALRTRRRVVVPDYRDCDFVVNSPTLDVFIKGNILSAQSTPLYSGAGKMIAMISTHWGVPHIPSGRDLALLDILSHHASNFLEHATRMQGETIK